MKTLKDILNECNSDKARKHHYHEAYNELFESYRDKEFNLLEIGVFKGESIEAWVKYFPKATIYGVDIFERESEQHIAILGHNRVRWAKQDSTLGSVKQWQGIEFDIIIDDGLHTPEANMRTFQNFWPQCSGTYFIEDVWPIHSMADLNNRWFKHHPGVYTREKHQELIDSLPENFKFIDCRQLSGEPDSYLIRVDRDANKSNSVERAQNI